jgi:porin
VVACAALVGDGAGAAEGPESAPAPADAPAGFWQDLVDRDHLLGEWLGARPFLEEHGVDLDVEVTQFVTSMLDGRGGRDGDFEYGGRGDAIVNVDGEKLGLWKGLFLNSHVELRWGETLLATGGTLMPTNTALLFPEPTGTSSSLSSLVVTQFLSESFGVSVGRFNFIDLYAKPYSGGRGVEKFMNLAFTVPPLMAGTVPPVTPFGVMLLALRGREPVLTLMVYDPRNAYTESGFDSEFFDDVAVLGEATLPVAPFGLPGHYAIGGEYSSRNATSLEQNPFVFIPPLNLPLAKQSGFWTTHFTFDQMLLRYGDPDEKDAGFGAFGMVGISDGDPSPLRWMAHVGLGGQSPIPTRRKDRFGVGWYYAGVSQDLVDTTSLVADLGDENGGEIFYDAAITGWLRLAADLQVIDPFTQPSKTATFFGLRARIAF